MSYLGTLALLMQTGNRKALPQMWIMKHHIHEMLPEKQIWETLTAPPVTHTQTHSGNNGKWKKAREPSVRKGVWLLYIQSAMECLIFKWVLDYIHWQPMGLVLWGGYFVFPDLNATCAKQRLGLLSLLLISLLWLIGLKIREQQKFVCLSGRSQHLTGVYLEYKHHQRKDFLLPLLEQRIQFYLVQHRCPMLSGVRKNEGSFDGHLFSLRTRASRHAD